MSDDFTIVRFDVSRICVFAFGPPGGTGVRLAISRLSVFSNALLLKDLTGWLICL